MKLGKIIYGSWKDGSDIFKDAKGYYIIQWNPETGNDFKQYLPKRWKPDPDTRQICRTSKKTKFCNIMNHKKGKNKTRKFRDVQISSL